MTTVTPALETKADAALGLALQLVAGTYAPPGAALRADLDAGAVRDAAVLLAEATGVEAPDLHVADWRDVQAGHVDLFVASGRGVAAPPYVGYAVDGELLGPTARAVKDVYDAHGVAPDADWRDMPDHVAAVAEAGALMLEAGRPDAARDLAARFVAPWLDRYADAVADRDDSGFYGPMSRFLHAAIREVTREPATAES